jgi:hypothetical protein
LPLPPHAFARLLLIVGKILCLDGIRWSKVSIWFSENRLAASEGDVTLMHTRALSLALFV